MNDQKQIGELFSRYLEDANVPGDYDQLIALLDDPFDNELLSEKLKELFDFQVKEQYNFPAVDARLKLRVMNHIQQQQGAVSYRRIHFLKTPWIRYAAAVILIFGAIAYFWGTNKKTDQILVNDKKQLQVDIAPGRDRAVLTLADGSSIMLDSARGNIVQLGNLHVISFAGQLRYEGVGANIAYNTLSTSKGGQYQVVLPDGSKVWLNAESSIKFPTAFSGSERKVSITGEAYMEVAKNTKQPFFVNANGVQIQVLGTSFNINAYNDDGLIKTTLIEGSVRVKSEDANKQSAAILKPGEQAVMRNEKLAISNNINVEQVIAWKNGFFNLQDLSLQEIIRQLERWYDIDIRSEGKLPERIFQGKLSRGMRLSTVLNWFSELGIHNRLEGRTLILTAD